MSEFVISRRKIVKLTEQASECFIWYCSCYFPSAQVLRHVRNGSLWDLWIVPA